MISTPSARRPLRATNQMPIAQRFGPWTLPPHEAVEVPMEFLELYGGAPGVVLDFSGVQELLRTRDEDGRPTFDFWCPLSALDGYGRHALGIVRGLKALGVTPVLRDAEWAETSRGDHPHLAASIMNEARANASRMPCRVGVAMSTPYDKVINTHSSVYKIVITQFETDRVPEYHIRQVNKVDHLIVTSSFQPEIWRRSGLRKDLPISILTAGIDTDFFEARQRPVGDTFRVLILGALTARKDPITAVRAFQEASRGDDRWRLTIKTRRAEGTLLLLDALGISHERDHLPGWPWRGQAPVDHRIEVVLSDDSPHQVREWYWSHDCLLWPSKGEGVGLPPLEAMATGMEVVMSSNSGMADYAFPTHCWPVGTAGMEPADIPGGFTRRYVDTYGAVGSWWVPSYGDLVRQLRRCHLAWARGKGKGRRAAEYVRRCHTLEHQARSVLAVVERYL